MVTGYVRWHVLMTFRNECYRAMSVECALRLWANVDYIELRDMYRMTQKNGNFWKTQQKLMKSKKKKLLPEIESLQLAF